MTYLSKQKRLRRKKIKMKYVIETDKSDLINNVAEELKGLETISPPSYSAFVRTGQDKQRPPVDREWWYFRAASVLVKVAFRGPIGVSKLRTLYGGRKRRGHKPAEFRKASGSILRKILQQLEASELIKHQAKGVHKGRILAPKGSSLLNRVAKKLGKTIVKPKAKKTETKSPSEKPKEQGKEQPKDQAKPKPEEKPAEKSTDIKSKDEPVEKKTPVKPEIKEKQKSKEVEKKAPEADKSEDKKEPEKKKENDKPEKQE